MKGEERGFAQLDLKKYNLEYLKNKNISALPDSDIDKLIEAFKAENIAPTVMGISYTPHDVNPLLSSSHCRRCGNCCIPNPTDTSHPGVMVLDGDLREIAQYSKYSYKHLLKKAPKNKDPSLPQQRYLPLPCIFFKKGKCLIYAHRPLVCRTYPITDTIRNDGISVDLRCDYGRDIYKNIINLIREEAYNSIIEKQFSKG